MTVAFKRATLSDLAYLFSFKVCCYLYKVKTFIPLNTQSQHIFFKKNYRLDRIIDRSNHHHHISFNICFMFLHGFKALKDFQALPKLSVFQITSDYLIHISLGRSLGNHLLPRRFHNFRPRTLFHSF